MCIDLSCLIHLSLWCIYYTWCCISQRFFLHTDISCCLLSIHFFVFQISAFWSKDEDRCELVQITNGTAFTAWLCHDITFQSHCCFALFAIVCVKCLFCLFSSSFCVECLRRLLVWSLFVLFNRFVCLDSKIWYVVVVVLVLVLVLVVVQMVLVVLVVLLVVLLLLFF